MTLSNRSDVRKLCSWLDTKLGKESIVIITAMYMGYVAGAQEVANLLLSVIMLYNTHNRNTTISYVSFNMKDRKQLGCLLAKKFDLTNHLRDSHPDIHLRKDY